MSNDDQRDGEVGYGKPPKHSQFVAGRSGNPKGRPKGSKNLAGMFLKAGRQFVTVNLAGRTVRMSKMEASLHQLMNKALGGDLRAIREMLFWFRLLSEEERGTVQPQALDDNEKQLAAGIIKRLQQRITKDFTKTVADNEQGETQ